MLFIDSWAKREKVPVPRKEIVRQMKADSITKYAVKRALDSLLRMGYVRRAIVGANKPLNEVSFVQLRRV